MSAKPGRPTRDPDGEAAKIVPIRMTDAERELYAKAAAKAGVSLSEWARDRLSRTAKRETGRK
jgi:predicted HicB family RNase H-like nuclease